MIKPKNLKVGDKFRVIEGNDDFKLGEIITLKKDDGTNYPFFWNEQKSDSYCIHFSNLEPVTKTVRDAQVGDVVVSNNKIRYERMVLERGQSTVIVSYADDFNIAGSILTLNELEKNYTLKAEPVEQTVLTMNEIAEKFGIEVSKLKITKE